MKYINIEEREPYINEIITCSAHGRVKYLGHGMVKLNSSGRIDKCEKWKPVKKWKHVFQIKHIDGISEVEAEGIVTGKEIIIEYFFQGMTYVQIFKIEKAGVVTGS